MMRKNHPSKTQQLAQALIAKASVTPHDAGCQELLAKHLAALDFQITHLPFGNVSNLWARRGTQAPLFVFAGHTDVVPAGTLTNWTSPPFEPTVRNGYLYGRGAADMKSSIAAMVIACENFLTDHPDFTGSIAFLITSDEEGIATDGTVKVVEHLTQQGVHMDHCLVGEASSSQTLGDTLKIGRRGSLGGQLILKGKQGHIAYPQLADNPIHKAFSILQALTNMIWDTGNAYFDPTSLQFSNIQSGTGATNVIPGDLSATFNFRYSPAVTAESLKARVIAQLDQSKQPYEITWRHSAKPFLTQPGKLTQICQEVIKQQLNITPTLSTSGGTSDARFIAPTGCEVLELGPINASIHQVDENIEINALNQLSTLYQAILKKLIT